MTLRDKIAQTICETRAVDNWLVQGSDYELADAIVAVIREGVLPLEWRKSHFNLWNGDWHTVPSGYTIRCADENGWKWSSGAGFGYSGSDEAAKAAAQSDYTRRILSALGIDQ